MAYRPYEYVPQMRRPDEGRLSELIYMQGQNEANRLRQQGQNNAAMWLGLGRVGSGMLSELAQYKREEPMRREAERVRKEKDKLRGLEQMAGAGGMDEQARGELLKREGFAELGQGILDKDMERKAKKATYDEAEHTRQARNLSEVVFALDKVKASPDPTTAYQQALPGLQEKLGKDKDKLPPQWDEPAIGGFYSAVETRQDVIARNAAAKAAAEAAKDNTATEKERLASAVNTLALTLPIADEPQEWENAWANVDTVLKDMPQAMKDRVLAQIPYARQFSPDAYERAKELDPRRSTKAQNPIEKADQLFHDQYGHDPKTPDERAEYGRILNEVAEANTPASRTDGMSTYRRGLDNEYQDKLLQLRLKVSNQEIDPEMAASGKAEIDAWYKAQLAQIGAAPSATGGGAPTGGAPRISGVQGPGSVLVMSPDGSEGRWESDKAKIAAMVAKGGKVSQGQAPTGAAPAAPTQAAPPTVPPVGQGAPLAQQALPAAAPPPPSRPRENNLYRSPENDPESPYYDPTQFRLFPRQSDVGPQQQSNVAPVSPQIAPWAAGGVGGAPARRPLAAAAGAIAPTPTGPPVTMPLANAVGGGTPADIVAKAPIKLTQNAPVSQRIEVMQALMNAAGYDVRPISTTRSADEQAELHRQGRTLRSGKPGDESQHQKGTAADFAFYKDGKRVPPTGQPWDLLGIAAERVGLEWGGNYNDPNHVELPPSRH